MDKEIATTQASASEIATHYDRDRMGQMLIMADKLMKAGCFGVDVKNAEQAFVKMQAGYEMGMPPVESMGALYIINGKITIYGTAMTKRMRKHGWKIASDESEGSCTVTVSRGDEVFSYTATKKELEELNSRAAKFAGKDKLFWHAVSRIIRRYIPEVLDAGVNYLAEEADFLTNEKATVNVVDGGAATYEKVKADLQAAITMEDIEKVKPDIVAIGSTLTDSEQAEIKAILVDKVKELKPQKPTPLEQKEKAIDEAIKKNEAEQEDLKEAAEVIDAAIGVLAPKPEDEKKNWKKPVKVSAFWSVDKIQDTVIGLKSHAELIGFKDEMNRLFNDGEITASTHKAGIAMIQEKIDKHWSDVSKNTNHY